MGMKYDFSVIKYLNIHFVTGQMSIDKLVNLNVSESSLIDFLKDQDEKELVVTMGTNPSGYLTIGHAFTFILGTYWVNRIAEAMGFSSRFILAVDDLSTYKGNGRQSETYKHHDPSYDEKIMEINSFAAEVNNALGTGIEVSLYSDIVQTESFRQILDEHQKFKLYGDTIPYIVPRLVDADGLSLDLDFNVANGEVAEYGPELRAYMDKNGLTAFIPSEHILTFENFSLMKIRDKFYNAKVHILGLDYEDAEIGVPETAYYTQPHIFLATKVSDNMMSEIHTSKGNAYFLKDMFLPDDWVHEIIDIAAVSGQHIYYIDYAHFVEGE